MGRRMFLTGLILLFLFPVIAGAQTIPFPGATEGTAAIPAPPATTPVPFIDLTIRNPESGQEVAFSLQLLLLLTVL